MKKKNLLKCLALTSMLALSVGAVTSCGTQGEAGKDGAQGAQGVQGAQGEKGDKGDKGDPVYTVVLLDSGISTDVISGIAGEKYTLTFTAPTSDQFVTKLTINYEEVPLTEEILAGSYTGTFSSEMKNGAVVVSASFGTATTYGQSLISDYYNSLAKNDEQMNILSVSAAGVATSTKRSGLAADVNKPEYVKDFVEGSYYDTTVAGVAKTYFDKIPTTLSGLKKDATTKDKIDAVKKLSEEAKTKVDEKYKKVVDAALVKGGKNIDTLYASGDSVKGMAAEDIASMKASAKADLAKATTLQGISKVIDKVAQSSPVLKGNYNEIERLRKVAQDKISDALKAVYTSDPSLNPGSTEATKEAYATFVATLSEFGITEDQLPTKVYNDYKTQISAATTFDYVVKDDATNYSATVLGNEGAKAISDSSKNVIGVVKKAVLDKYYKEIDASEALTDKTAKENCKGKVETTVSAWFTTHATDSLGSVTNFLLYTDIPSASVPGGLKAIETLLASDFTAFNAERLANYKKTAVTDIQAKGAEYIDSDTLYKSIINATIGSLTTDEYATDAEAATHFEVATDSVTHLRTLGASADVATTYNLQKYVNAITVNKDGTVKTSGNDDGYIKDNMHSVLELLTYKAGIIKNLKTIHDKAVTKFIADEKANLGGTVSVHANYGSYAVTDNDITSKFDLLFATTDNVTTAQEKIKNANTSNWVGLVDSLGLQYHNWWSAIEAATSDSESTYNKATLSEIWKAVQAGVTSIIKGEITTYDQVKAVIDGLNEKYGLTVSNYYASQLKALGDVKTSTVNALTSGHGAQAEIATSRYNNWVAVANQGSFEFASYADVDAWFAFASADISAVVDATLVTADVDLAHDLDDARIAALGLIDGAFDTIKVSDNLLTADERKYSDVLAKVYDAQDGVLAANKVSTIEDIIKDTNGVLSGSFVDAITSDLLTLGKARLTALDNLDALYKLELAAITGTDDAAKAKKAALAAQYDVEVASIEDYSTNDTVAKIEAIIKVIDNPASPDVIANYAGSSAKADFETETTYLASYKTSAALVAGNYFNKAVIENPGKNTDLFGLTAYAEKTTVAEVYAELNRYIADIDAKVND